MVRQRVGNTVVPQSSPLLEAQLFRQMAALSGGGIRKCEHDVNKIIETIKNSTLTTLARLVVCNPFTKELQTKKNSCILSGALPNKHQPESSTVASKQQGTTQTYRCHIAINFAEHSVVIFREF